MTRLPARLLAVLVPAALLVPAAAAHADRMTFDDASGDASAVDVAVALGGLLGSSTEEGPLLLDAPAETSSDVVRTTVDHARKRLTLTVQLRDLVDTDGSSVEFRLFTPEGRYVLAVGAVDGRTVADLIPIGRDSTTVAVSEDGTVTITEGPFVKPCRTVRARYDVGTDTLTASAPTSCLGSPKWVQVAAAVSRTQVTPLGDGSANIASYVDDAFRGGVSMRSLGRSPKVRRG